MRCEHCGRGVAIECASRAWCSPECHAAWMEEHRAEWEAEGWIAVEDAPPAALADLGDLLSTPVIN